jgi:hypothetical protein
MNQQVSADQAAIMADHDRDCGERVLAFLKATPGVKLSRFREAAKQAGSALELLKPGIMAGTPEGLLAGCYSVAPRGDVLIVAADHRRSIYCTFPAKQIDVVIAEAATKIARGPPEARMAREQGALSVLAAADNLDAYGRNAVGGRPGWCQASLFLSEMLAGDGLREVVSKLADTRLVPAVVCLLAKDRQGCLRFPLVHGRPWPEHLLGASACAA